MHANKPRKLTPSQAKSLGMGRIDIALPWFEARRSSPKRHRRNNCKDAQSREIGGLNRKLQCVKCRPFQNRGRPPAGLSFRLGIWLLQIDLTLNDSGDEVVPVRGDVRPHSMVAATNSSRQRFHLASATPSSCLRANGYTTDTWHPKMQKGLVAFTTTP